VLVTGLGPIAFAAAIASRCRGWQTTIEGRDAADTYRATLATQFGLAYRRQNESEISSDAVDRDGYDLVLECTGSDEVLIRATRMLASRGVMVWLGSSRTAKPASMDVARMMRDGVLRNHIHIGSVNAAPRDFQAALDHLDQLRTTHASALSGLITDRVTPQEAPPHFSHRQPQGIKTVVEF
jgi:threonine dehydrogenase-like Zn-dependent dehydrogenase